MPISRATLATWLPTCPSPTMPRILPCSWLPMNLLRSHLSARIDASAGAMLRLNAISSAKVCSAAATVLPRGELTTKMPVSVAALTLTLSTPTPARPMILSFLLERMIFSVTLVPLRTIMASYSGMISHIWSSVSLVLTSTSATVERMSMPALSMLSLTNTRNRRLLKESYLFICTMSGMCQRGIAQRFCLLRWMDECTSR
mmetsp:Transcript_49137/g.123167  ORF Transcript_49137/g.123167 Transcript_49137/m.123167 type:complete len:201 (-) Transcript_49137:144-746(-)